MDTEGVIEQAVKYRMRYLMKATSELDREEITKSITDKLLTDFESYGECGDADRNNILLDCITDIICLMAAKETRDE